MTGDNQYEKLRQRAALELDRVIGPPVEVTPDLLSECRTSKQFGPVVFELYKEAGKLINLCCMLYSGSEPHGKLLNRNQAICTGLLVRISKLMLSVIKLSADTEHGETVKILNRCILESTVNLRYLLLKKNDPRIFDRFVESSLRPEVELYDFIQDNIGKNGGRKLAIEDRMIKSILDTFDKSGIDLDSARHKRGAWGGSFRDKLSVLNMEEAYAALQMVPSHAVHGDWVEILKEHLVPSGNRFEACIEWRKTDGEMLGTVANFAIEAGLEYLREYFEGPLTAALEERLEDLMHRNLRTEMSREDWQEID